MNTSKVFRCSAPIRRSMCDSSPLHDGRRVDEIDVGVALDEQFHLRAHHPADRLLVERGVPRTKAGGAR